MLKLLSLSTISWCLVTTAAAGTTASLESALQSEHWNEAAQTALETLDHSAQDPELRMKTAYALFQRGFPNAALLVLSKMRPSDWKLVPQGQDRFAEVVALMQKTIPLNLMPSRLEQVVIEDAAPALQDEIRFARGREAFEKNNFGVAIGFLNQIPVRSRFYAQARYILATIAVKSENYKVAIAELTKLFEPAVLEQSTEFWREMSAQMTTHWGTNLKVMFDSSSLAESKKTAELAVLAMARIAYATKDFEGALRQYAKLPTDSAFFPRASLEKIWTLLALNQHEEAQKVAVALAVNDASFESLEARSARALVLTDIGRTVEARQELDIFNSVFKKARTALTDYNSSAGITVLPSFLQTDVQQDIRIQTLLKYQSELRAEIKALREEDHQLFPAYLKMAVQLDPLLGQAKLLTAKLIQEHVHKRREDLDRIFLQSRLILVETLLEDREKLRNEFKNAHEMSEQQQNEHDERLAALLKQSVDEVESLRVANKKSDPNLEFRQSELLWELSSATMILSQIKRDEKVEKLADSIKQRSIDIALQIVKKYPKFEKHAQSLFFSGFALSELGRVNESVVLLERYVSTYPKHTHVPDAYRILADTQFDKNNFKAAQDLYRKILEFPDSRVVGYALYKIGWCAYNLRDFAKAILGLEKAVVWASRASKEGSLLSLNREARRDLITLYAEVGDHKKAEEYFSQFLQQDSKSWLADLASELDAMGQYEKAGDLYNLLIAMDPGSEENVVYQAHIVQGLYQLRRWSNVIDSTGVLVDKYKAKLTTPLPAENPISKVEKIVRDAALTQHFEYKRRPSPEAGKFVEALDRVYLSAFRQWPESQEPQYRFAHYLLEEKRNAEASTAFILHWEQFKGSLKEPLKEESLRNLVHAVDEVEQAKIVESTEKNSTLTENARAATTYSLEYETLYPNTKYTRLISYLRPAILFKYGKSAEGMIESQKLFDTNPSDEVGNRCFKNLRQAYYQQKNWEETHKWSQTLLSRNDPRLDQYKNDLLSVNEESLFLWAENTKDDHVASNLYYQLWKNPKSGRLKEKALYNAFIRTEKTGQKLKALELADELEKSAPKFENLAEVSGVRAAMYQDAGDYERALPLLEEFLRHHTKGVGKEIVLQAHYNAGLIAEAANKLDSALTHYRAYLKGATAPLPEASRGIQRIEGRGRGLVTPVFAKWPTLLKAKEEFERKPVPKSNDLAVRIKNSSAKLEQITKMFSDVSSAKTTPTYNAFEAFCALPLMYKKYGIAVLGIAESKEFKKQEADELRVELQKIVDPINLRANELATQCMAKSGEVEHDGPFYREVLGIWGWLADVARKSRAEALLVSMSKSAPWFDTSSLALGEPDLVRMHIEGKGNEESWYSLARIRYDQKKYALSRLTLVDAMAQFPSSGRLLNAFAVIESRRSEKVTHLFEKSAELKSNAASANLALIHLKTHYLPAIEQSLARALSSGVFKDAAETEKLAEEFMKK